VADPYFASVVLLAVNDNAADGTTTFVDQSSSAKTITNVNSAAYSSARAATGMTTSGLFNGSNQRLSVAASTDFSFDADFTWEAYVYRSDHTGNDTLINIGAADQFTWYLTTDGKVNYFDGSNHLLGANTVSDATFTHVALVRSGTTLTSYIGGVAGGTPYTVATTIGGNLALTIANDLGAAYWPGNFDSIRITKGVARYTANFTPPSLPFPTTAVDPPVANFSGTPLSGNAPLSVVFTDASTNAPTSWLWEKNSGSGWVNFATSPTAQNPTESFTAATWSVRLTATNAAGSNTKTRTNYITVTSSADTHDGGKRKPWRQRLEFGKDETEARAKEYRANRERLRQDIIFAMDGPIEAEVIDLVREHIEPEELAQLSAPDFEPQLRGLLSQTEALRNLAALVLSEHKRQEDEDEEDVEILLLH